MKRGLLFLLSAALFTLCPSASAGYYPFGDLHWKAPVASQSALPLSGNLVGDARIETTDFNIYAWTGSEWQEVSGGSGGSPGGSSTDVQYNASGSFGGNSHFTYDGNGSVSLSAKLSCASANISGLTDSEPVVTDGSDNLASGSVSSPLTFSSGAFGCQMASGSQAGCLSSSDWNTFNGKEEALTFDAPLVNTTGTVTCNVASGSQAGCLSSADWTTFNNKSPAGNYATSGSGDVSWSAPSGPGAVTTSLVAISNSTLTTLSALTTASSLATVGTIGTGTWHGTAVGAAYGGTGINTSSSTGYPSISSGTWSVASAANTFISLFETVATTTGDLIYGGSSGTPTRLAGNTSSTTEVLTETGTGSAAQAPSFQSVPGNTSLLKAPTVQKFTSSSGTYTTPTSPSPLYIRVRMVGGGGGGGGSGSSGAGTGGAGGNTTFGSSLLVADGGSGGGAGTGSNASGLGGQGGSASLGSGPIGIALTGGWGAPGINANGNSGSGASTPFGGSGGGVYGGGSGSNGVTNTGGGGGGGGGSSSFVGGGGGGGGGYVDAIITSPSSSYSYAVGAAGSAGTAGTSGEAGGSGGSGLIIVEEFYQ